MSRCKVRGRAYAALAGPQTAQFQGYNYTHGELQVIRFSVPTLAVLIGILISNCG